MKLQEVTRNAVPSSHAHLLALPALFWSTKMTLRFRGSIVALKVATAVVIGGLATFAVAQDIVRSVPDGLVVVPSSSIERPGDRGHRAHTNIILHIHNDDLRSDGLASPGPTFEKPASIGCVYQITAQVAGCPIATTTENPSGGSGAIALVDAYDYPTAANDLSVFSKQFGLPAANFQVVYATGVKPAQDPTGGWEGEAALDIEWAHAMAPQAQIILVEAASSSDYDLYTAVQVASSKVAAAGGGEVSMSWGGGEYPTETSDDANFTTAGVVYVASTGDAEGQLEYPAVSPNVLAAGGTLLQRDAFGNFTAETFWDDNACPPTTGGGGGISLYESRPAYQNFISGIVGTHRGVPDVSSDASCISGVAVYTSTALGAFGTGWFQFGGTSVAAPTLAGRANAQGDVNVDTNPVLSEIYTDYSLPFEHSAEFRDITQNLEDGSGCRLGWDVCSGVGSPLGNASLTVGGDIIVWWLPPLELVWTGLPWPPRPDPCDVCLIEQIFNPEQLIWTYIDPTLLAGGPSLAGGSTLAGYGNPIAGTQEVFYLTVDSQGHEGVEQLYSYDNSTWYSGNLVANIGAKPAAPRSSLVGFIDGVASSDNLFYMGIDQHVHALVWTSQGGWSTTDLTSASHAVTAAGRLLAGHISGQGSSQRQEVFYFGFDQHVHELWRTSKIASWHTTDVTTTARAPYAVVGSPLTGFYDSISGADTLFYVGTDQHIHEIARSAKGAWSTTDLTATSGAPPVPTGGKIGAHLNTILGTEEVFFVTPDQNVQQVWSVSIGTPGWHTLDVSAAAGSPAYPLLTSALSTLVDPAANPPRDEIYYLGADQHVHELFEVNSAWGYDDVTSASGSPNSIP